MTRGGYFGVLAARLRRPPPPAADVATEGTPDDTVRATHVLSDFVAGIRARTSPVVIDLGPTNGPNVAFLGQELACKLFIEDVLARLAKTSNRGGIGQPLRLRQPDGSADGILCWDVLDHFAPAARPVLAAELVRVLRPEGLLLLYQRLEVVSHPDRVVYEIMNPSRLCLRRHGAPSVRVERPLQHRELEIMFGGLTAVKTVLLKDGMREVLFRNSELASTAD